MIDFEAIKLAPFTECDIDILADRRDLSCMHVCLFEQERLLFAIETVHHNFALLVEVISLPVIAHVNNSIVELVVRESSNGPISSLL